MAAAVGTLAVNIVANHSAFTRGCQNVKAGATGLVRDITGSFGKMAGSIGQLGGAALSRFGGILTSSFTGIAGVAVSASAAIQGLNNQVEKFNELIDLADVLGTTAGKLQELQFAASQNSVSTDILTGSLEKMMATVGQAASGGANPFANLGLSAEALALKPVEQQVRDVAEAIRGLKTPAEQAAAAKEIFGRSGMKMLPMLRQGSAGIDGLAQSFRNMGGALSDIDVDKLDLIDRQMAMGAAAREASAKSAASWWAGMKGEIADTFSWVTTGTTVVSASIEQVKRLKNATSDLASHQKKIAEAREAALMAETEKSHTKRMADEARKMREEAEAMKRSLQTPWETAHAGIEKASKLLAMGAIDAEVYRRQVAKITEEYQSTTKSAKDLRRAEEDKGTDVATRGSAAAHNFEQQFLRSAVARAEERKAEIAELKAQTALQRQLLAAAKANAGNGVELTEVGLGS